MQTFRFKQDSIRSDDSRLPAFLAAVHGASQRPVCLCVPAGVPMYVARLADRHVIKRMPHSGAHHRMDCDSYVPPAELSGVGEVSGSAIQEDTETGVTALKLDFSLAKTGARNAPVASGIEPDSVRTDGAKLTLRGVLHYLWDEAGLNRWTPAMDGKRSWYVVRKYLLQAAESKTTKGSALGSMLFMPETFSLDRKDELLKRRLAQLSRLNDPEASTTKLMLLIGEVKLIEPSRFGHRLIVKHLPDLPLMLADDIHNRLLKRFENDIELWNANEATHLVVIATFGIGPTGVASVEEMALMVATAGWIPAEHVQDLQLLDQLTIEQRRFSKALRYNLAGDRLLASVVMSDTLPRPVALYIVPPEASTNYTTALEQLTDASDLATWTCRSGEEAMPALPALVDDEPHSPPETAFSQ